MRVVIDTNILLTSVSRKSKTSWVVTELISGEYQLCVTTEILLEYEEIIARHMGFQFASFVMKTLLQSPYLVFIKPYYNWQFITADPDDNKFVDCAIAGNAKFLVSHDKHFKILNEIDFPKVDLINIETFKKELENEKSK